ncbi:hypothetical protein Dda_4842 [Drechslerella dactyloides]|uniref:Uncharacterized protein n=1 Tax=Drechslerella dactyloides TaxID=74499 RepID=A0AAD6IY33_DREDA|nr:hypothetical protein Dda_4842 [Drechslerella dactyloides]
MSFTLKADVTIDNQSDTDLEFKDISPGDAVGGDPAPWPAKIPAKTKTPPFTVSVFRPRLTTVVLDYGAATFSFTSDEKAQEIFALSQTLKMAYVFSVAVTIDNNSDNDLTLNKCTITKSDGREFLEEEVCPKVIHAQNSATFKVPFISPRLCKVTMEYDGATFWYLSDEMGQDVKEFGPAGAKLDTGPKLYDRTITWEYS